MILRSTGDLAQRQRWWVRLSLMLAMLIVAGGLGCTRGRPLTPGGLSGSGPLERKESQRAAPVHVEAVHWSFTLNADGTYESRFKQRYRILDQQGVEGWAHTEAYWSPWYMERPKLHATVTNRAADGQATTTELQQRVVTEQPAYPDAPQIYSDSRVLRAPLPSVRVGSIVEEEIVTKTHRPFLAKEHMHDIVFPVGVPRDKVVLTVDAPSDLPLKFEVRDADVKREEREVGGRRVVTYTGGPYAALEPPEPLLPSDVPEWPSVGFGTGQDWGSLAAGYAKLIDDKLRGIDFSSTVAQLVKPNDTDKVKAAKLFAWVKDKVRYVGVEFGESGVIPYPPDQVIGQGYGDCKDQATLLVGLLRAAGLPAHVALLRAGRREDIVAGLPAMNVFNHAIVVVRTEEPLWLDPTADLLPPGSLPVGDQGRLALVAAPDTEGLVLTPEPTPATNTYREQRVVYFAPHGAPRIVEKSSGSGALEQELREVFAAPAKDLTENLTKYVKDAYKAKALGKTKPGAPLDLLEPFRGEIEAVDCDMGVTALLDASTVLPEGIVFRWLPEALIRGEEERKAELVLPIPYTAEVVWEVHPPPGFLAETLPEDLEMQLGPMHFERRTTKRPDGVVQVTSRLDTRRRRFSPQEVQAIRDAVWKYEQTGLNYVLFNHHAKALSDAGKSHEGVRLLQKEVQDNPKDGRAKMRLAQLLAPFVNEAALSLAKEAVRLAPKDQQLWAVYADLLSKSPVGEDLAPGYHREAAIQAYDKAKELDPEDLKVKLRLAYLLEHDDEGQRYASKDLGRAIQLYESIPEKELAEYEGGGFRLNALFAMYWAGSYAAVEQRIGQLSRGDVPANLAVMNAASGHGADAALAEAKRLGLTGKELASAFEEGAMALVRKRKYTEAAHLLDLASANSDNAIALQQRSRLLGKVTPKTVSKLPSGSPKDLVLKFLATVAYHSNGKKDDAVRAVTPFFSKALLAAEDGAEDAVGAKYSKVQRQVLTDEILADFTVGAVHLDVQGSDAVGFRVTSRLEAGSTNTVHRFYVLREGGEYKIRAAGDQTSELGAEALGAVLRGDQKRAAQWLDWAREGMSGGGGDDPLQPGPFHRTWKEGKGDAKLAAAVLALGSSDTKQAVQILEKALAAAKDVTRQQLIDQALCIGYAHLEQHAKKLEAGRRLFKQLPKSKTARGLVMTALWDLKRYAEYADLVKDELKGATEEQEVVWLKDRLIDSHVARADLAGAARIADELIKTRKADASIYNGRAWESLFTAVEDRHVDHALKAVELSKNGAGALHTLACIYAELGKVDDALRTLKQLIAKRPDKQFQSVDHYIVGRIAESLGLADAAMAAYRRVEKPKQDWPTATYHLAQKALKRLR